MEGRDAERRKLSFAPFLRFGGVLVVPVDAATSSMSRLAGIVRDGGTAEEAGAGLGTLCVAVSRGRVEVVITLRTLCCWRAAAEADNKGVDPTAERDAG